MAKDGYPAMDTPIQEQSTLSDDENAGFIQIPSEIKTRVQGVDRSDPYYLNLFELEALQHVKIATKTDRRLLDTPSSVTVYTINTLEELMNYVPGMLVNRNVRATGPTGIIGVRSAGIASLVLYDGQRLNDFHSGFATFFDRGISLKNLDRVEIIRGPGSTLYGSSALIGVINLIPATNHNTLAITGGTQEVRQVTLNVSENLGDLELTAFGNYSEDSGDDYDNLFNAATLTEVSGDDPQENIDVTVISKFRNLRGLYRFAHNDRDEFIGFTGFASAENQSSNSSHLGTLEYTYPLLDRLEGNIIANYQYNFWDVSTPLPLFPFGGGTLESRVEHRMVIAQSNFKWPMRSHHPFNWPTPHTHQFIWGFEFLEAASPVAENRINGGPPISIVSDKKIRNISAYIQDEIKIGKHWDFVLGTRLDRQRFGGTEWSPRATLIFAPTPEDRLKLNYGHGFRSPSLAPLFNEGANIIGNPDLQPLSIDTIEFVYARATKNLHMTLTYFYNSVKEDTLILPSSAPGRLTFENGLDRDNQGIEIEADFKPVESLRIRANFTSVFSNSTNVSFSPTNLDFADVSPNSFGSLSITYRHEPWLMNLNVFAQDGPEALPEQEAYAIWNARIEHALRPGMKIFINAKNIFDKSYDSTEGAGGLGIDGNGEIRREVPNRGRQIFVGVEVNW